MYFKISNCTIVAKDPAYAGKAFPTHAQRKRERGDSSPRTQSPVSPFCCPYAARNSGGQNLAALSAAAGENLAAVSSGHSLAEAMNLGTMTLGGLIGTLHEIHLLINLKSCSTAKWPQQHIIRDYKNPYCCIVTEKCDKVNIFLQIYEKNSDYYKVL